MIDLHLPRNPTFSASEFNHQQRIPKDHPVRPVQVVLVELNRLVEVVLQPGEIAEQVELAFCRHAAGGSATPAQVLDQGAGVDLSWM